jgi:outer membrane receptor protein involved in Fe transport
MAFAAPTVAAQDETTTRTLDAVVVTTQKKAESIQDVPIAVSAFSEEALDKLQLAAGPDLVKSIPNVSFTKGNFTSANFKVRGIGNDAVGNSTDAGVGVHQNDVPLTQNRLFEAEFFDVERVETLRGPQGTIYGRNATAGVVNVITAKPVLEEFQADVRLTAGNFNTLKAKGMVNIPLGETAALRLAGSRLVRDGYVDNLVTGNDVDDRDLFGLRATLAWEPTDKLRGWVMVEHFEEDDSRLRTGKQKCDKDPFETSFAGIDIAAGDQIYTSLGCQEARLGDSTGTVNSAATLAGGLGVAAGLFSTTAADVNIDNFIADLRTIESAFDPQYQADQTLYSWNAQYDLTDDLTVTYLGSYNESSVNSAEDYNKAAPTIAFNDLSFIPPGLDAGADLYNALFPGGVVSDPQVGVSNLFRTFDQSALSTEQSTHELRIQSDFDGPFNFNLGAIKVDFETGGDIDDSFYVFSNTLTAVAQLNNAIYGGTLQGALAAGADQATAEAAANAAAILGGFVPIDTSNPGDGLAANIDGNGRNYFRSTSPYTLDSFAIFGEGYYDVTDNLQLTVGLRYTSDDKEQVNQPSLLYTPTSIVPEGQSGAAQLGQPELLTASFEEVTGRVGFDWSPDLSWSQDTLIYGFYSKGYKGGGINPPQQIGAEAFAQLFDPEFVNSFEVGTKNTLANGLLQLNANAFFYDYEGYQITQIINRSSVNFNVDAEIRGLEIEGIWSPVENLNINASLGLLDTEIIDEFAIDVLNRTSGDANFVVLKNAANFANCVVSAQGYATVLGAISAGALAEGSTAGLCVGAFAGQEAAFGLGDVTYTNGDGSIGTVGALTPFEGITTDISGNSIPGAPESTFNIGADYTWEGVRDSAWDITVRGDYYVQGESFSRVWNTGRDELESWNNVNLSLRIMNTENNWGIELFGKNITDEEVITGSYLTDDSSGLFTNVFLTEPQTYGITVSKAW